MPFVPDVKPFHAVLNNVSSTTAGSIDGATDPVTFSVAAGEGANFPQPTTDGDFLISVDNEILNCTTRTADSLTCDRAQDGTTIASHVSGSAVELRIVANAMTEIHGAVTLMLEGWALDDDQNPTLGVIPANAFVYRVDVWLEEAFDSDGTDQITVGYDGNTNAYVTLLTVDGVGLREHIDEGHGNAGAVLGTVDATSRSVEIYYLNGGSEPTAGKVFVVLHYILATAEPA
jgi:hypothetical protein